MDIDVESNLVSLGGFSPAQASEINTRYEELAAEARALYEEAQAAGRDPYPASIEGLDRAERIMREELGDADYARFRRARRMSTSVHVERVLPGSNAEAAGLLPGDEIISYGGHRVMDLRDLERVAGAAQPGTAVLLEVNRSGQPTFLTASHGVLGVTELNALTRIARERRAMEDSPREYP